MTDPIPTGNEQHPGWHVTTDHLRVVSCTARHATDRLRLSAGAALDGIDQLRVKLKWVKLERGDDPCLQTLFVGDTQDRLPHHVVDL